MKITSIGNIFLEAYVCVIIKVCAWLALGNSSQIPKLHACCLDQRVAITASHASWSYDLAIKSPSHTQGFKR